MADPGENVQWFRQHTKDLMFGNEDAFDRLAQPDTAIGRIFSKTFSEFQPYFSRVNSLQDQDFDRIHHHHQLPSSIPASQDSLMNRRGGVGNNDLGYGMGAPLHMPDPNPSLLSSLLADLDNNRGVEYFLAASQSSQGAGNLFSRMVDTS